jgi:hypothetical protein
MLMAMSNSDSRNRKTLMQVRMSMSSMKRRKMDLAYWMGLRMRN